MLKYFDGLVSEQFDKPFECIGTREEINAALTKTLEKRTGHLHLLLEKYKEKYYDKNFDITSVDTFFDENNNVPNELKEELKWKRTDSLFKDKKVLILGFGREGRTTYEFLKDKVPSAEITVADAKRAKTTSVSPCGCVSFEQFNCKTVFGEHYMDDLGGYDIIMKSPRNTDTQRLRRRSRKQNNIADRSVSPILSRDGYRHNGHKRQIDNIFADISYSEKMRKKNTACGQHRCSSILRYGEYQIRYRRCIRNSAATNYRNM